MKNLRKKKKKFGLALGGHIVGGRHKDKGGETLLDKLRRGVGGKLKRRRG